MKTNYLLPSKPHFDVLDGLRGIAAIAVLIFHFAEIIFPDLSDNFIAHGFLAVDFFFCLSGFVVAYAYQDRIQNMRLSDFAIARLIRLHPLVVFGSILGFLAFVFDPLSTYQYAYGIGQKLVYFLLSIFMIPYPMMEERYFNLFNLNAPAWSLFWEYAVNIVFAILLYRLSKYSLLALLFISAGLLVYISFTSGNLLGGWSGETFWHGGVRVLYSFIAGMLLYRFNFIFQNKLGLIILSLLLTITFFMPYTNWSWLTELIIVMLYFPMLILLGAGAAISNCATSVCRFLGNISYPLYMTHYSIMWIFGAYYSQYKPSGILLWAVVFSLIILLIGVSYLTYKWFDSPIRRLLSKYFLNKK